MAENNKPACLEVFPAQVVQEGTTSVSAADPAQPIQTADTAGGDQQHARLDPTAQDQPQDIHIRCLYLEQQLNRRTQQRDYFKAKYQALATQFNKANSQDRGFPQLDDSYLVNLIQGLRTQIWKFAISHFGEVSRRQGITPNTLLSHYMDRTVRNDIRPEWYLDSPEHRPMLIEAFLWRLLVAKIFNGFWWAGDARRAAREAYAAMKQCLLSTVEDIQTFQKWSATTTRFIQESRKRAGESWNNSYTEKEEKNLVAEIHKTIEPYSISTHTGFGQDLYDILNKAIHIDEKISEQLPQFEWISPFPEAENFDPQRMQLEDGEETPGQAATTAPSIVICPGLTKRGRSTGEGFNKENLLMRMKVSCAVPVDERSHWHAVVSFLCDKLLTSLEKITR